MKKLKFVFVLGILFIGIRCNDAVNDEEIMNRRESVILENVNYSPVFVNPYEEIGEYHNDGLKYVFEEYRKQSMSRSNINQQEVLNELMINYFSEKGLPKGIEVSRKESEDFFKEMSKSAISRAGKADFENTLQQKYCAEVRGLLNGKKAISSPQALVTEINIIEKKVVESEMPELEKAQVLIATAVAKHSSIFWIEQFMAMDDTPVSMKSRSAESGSGGPDWLGWFERVFMPKAMQVLEADFAGAIAGIVEGFFFGGAVGSIVPGAGTVTVAITGAIADGTRGAIWGSVCEGIGIHWTFWRD